MTVKVQGGVAVTPDELTYQVENEAVAHVDASGTVTAVGVGTTKITITAMVNGTKLTKDIQVTVQFGLNEEDIQVTSQFGAVLLQWEKGADLDVTVTRMNPDGSSKILTVRIWAWATMIRMWRQERPIPISSSAKKATWPLHR